MLKIPHYSALLDLCREVGTFIQSNLEKLNQNDIEYKADNSLVSYVDKTAEQMIIRGLSSLTPNLGFLGEEGTVAFDNQNSDFWIIDPLDGTTNFTHGIPVYCISLGRYKDGHLIEGYVYDIPNQSMYAAALGQGAYKDGKPLIFQAEHNWQHALIATGFPRGLDEDLSYYFEIFKYFALNTRGVRRLGSAAMDLVWLADNKFQVFYEIDLKPWDIAGGLLIAQEAGAHVSNFDGDKDALWTGQVVVAHPQIHAQIMKIIQENYSSKT
jgi:myo-inositol-1(or 4)-monophosphatase